MTTEQLANILNAAILVLQDNKQIVTPDTLTGISNIIEQLKPVEKSSEQITTTLQKVSMIVDIEKRLIETTLTDDLITLLSSIQNHPIIMHMLAHVL